MSLELELLQGPTYSSMNILDKITNGCIKTDYLFSHLYVGVCEKGFVLKMVCSTHCTSWILLYIKVANRNQNIDQV